MEKALITGITGQDGAYLAEYLLKKGYEVHGIKRRSSSLNTARVDHLYRDPHEEDVHFFMHYGDLTDATNLIRIVQEVQPDEIYNLAAQSHVKVSFETAEYTANADALGTLRLLEAVRILDMVDRVRFYQASTSELYGKALEVPQNEKTPFYPRSPYGAAKLFAYWICVNYREAYKIFACNGILFNHESPLRGETFVSRKITRAVARLNLGFENKLYLGNLDAKRDWGHAADYVRAMWLMLQQEKADDYVIATGEARSVREFVEVAFREIGVGIEWRGEGVEEKGIVKRVTSDELRVTGEEEGQRTKDKGQRTNQREGKAVTSDELRVTGEEEGQRTEDQGQRTKDQGQRTNHRDEEAVPRSAFPVLRSRATAEGGRVPSLREGDVIVEIDPRYFRPTEVDFLLGDASKARRDLGWIPRISFDEMVREMVKSDIEEARRDQLCRDSGFRVLNFSDE